MFSGLFDPAHVRAQKQAARANCALRQRAATNFQIEVQLLQKAAALADRQWRAAGDNNNQSLTTLLASAFSSYREFMSSNEVTTNLVFRELEEITNRANITKDYRQLAALEADLRSTFETKTGQARMILDEFNKASGAATTAGY